MFAAKDLLATRGGYKIGRSLRFRSSASAYLSRTPSVAGNQQIFTWSGWVKKAVIGSQCALFDASSGSNECVLVWGSPVKMDDLQFYAYNGSYVFQYTTTNVFRDPSAWYHVVVAMDTTQATANNRCRMYVNGVEVAYTTRTNPAQNTNTLVNSAISHSIGRQGGSLNRWYNDGNLAEVNFIDGQALTPSSFGENDATTGVWKPKAYTGTYGTNGFYLKFADNSAATAAAIGKDSSGNGNNWTPTNIVVTSGTTCDSMIDTPTPYDDGTAYGVGNYCVMNPIQSKFTTTDVTVVYLNANLQTNNAAGGGTGNVLGTIGASSGAYYFEVYCNGNSGSGNIIVGVQNESTTYGTGGGLRNNGTVTGGFSITSGTAPTFTTTDIIGFAINLTGSAFQIYKNGTLACSGTMTYAANTTAWAQMNGAADSLIWNFGQRPFTYTPPSGFKALNTQNLPTPTIAAGNKYFDATTYSGNSTIQNVVNSGSFQPDLVWVKCRSTAYDNILNDAVRGAGNYLVSNTTAANVNNTVIFSAFNSNGFQLDNAAQTNATGQTYVGWQWKANGSGTSNTSGTITSTVSANVTAGFSVVTWTATGANATVGHGLGVAPQMVIVKVRNGVGGWPIYHISLTSAAYILELQSTNAQSSVPTAWNSTAPTSSVFSTGTAFSNSSQYVAYCFAAVSGYSAFGSYTGNGSADGPFVFTGFRPRWIMIKRTDAADAWVIEDTSRDTYNVDTKFLLANASDAEGSTTLRDVLSNGFKMRGTAQNVSGATYVYAAFAENPLKYSLAR